MGEQDSVRSGHLKVIAFDRDGRQDRFDISLPGPPPASIGKFDTYEKLCCSDRGNRDVVFVADQVVEDLSVSLCSDENGRVQDQAVQRRSSAPTTARRSRSSFSQARSRACP